MGLSIRTNMPALNAIRHHGNVTQGFTESFQRLSSGLRINSAGDDAAGVGIASRFTSEVRGLGQAMRNANDAVSLAQVAETALSEANNLLQRMRELAIQSANDINTARDRQNLNMEIDQLKEELTRIGDSTTFNQRKVLDGSFRDAFFHIGAEERQAVSITINDARSDQIGRAATKNGTVVTTDALTLGDVFLNGVTIRATIPQDDPHSTSLSDASAIAKAAAINDTSQFHGVTARAMPTEFTATNRIAGGTLNQANHIVVNGHIISNIDVLPDDADNTLVNAINLISGDTGVFASLDANGRLTLRSDDGRNIEVEVVGNGGNIVGQPATKVETAELNLYSEVQYQVTGANEAYIGFGNDEQVAINTNESITTVDVLTRFNANEAILRIDRALDQVIADRARLGGITNRMNNTMRNLAAVREATIQARSRIEDTDFAQESASLARTQVLQQAGIAIIGQANSVPQAALSLLQQ